MPAETHVERAPLDRQAVFELIRDRLADILEIEPSTITEGASFADDLDADSLALIELVEALEEELGERTVGFRIDDEDLEDLKTVRDAVDYVYGRLGEASWFERPAIEVLSAGSGMSSPTLPFSCRHSPIVRGVPSRRARSSHIRRRTSGSSSSATPCSARSSPTTSTTSTPSCPRASWPTRGSRS